MTEATSATEQIQELMRAEIDKDSTLTMAAALGRVATREPALYGRASRENTYTSGQGIRLSHTNDASAAEDALGLKPVRFPTQPRKTTTEPVKPTSSAGPAVSAAYAIIQDKVDEIVARTGISRIAATNQALAENPSFYPAYVEEFRRRAAGEDINDES